MDFTAIRHQFFSAFTQWLLQEAVLIFSKPQPYPDVTPAPAPDPASSDNQQPASTSP